MSVFYGIGAAVIAIVARSAVKLARLTLARDPLLWCLFGVSCVVTTWTESEVVWVFLGSGVVALLARAPPRRVGPASVLAWALHPMATALPIIAAAAPSTFETLGRIAWYFARAGTFVFGSGLAIVPFLHGGVVDELHWLTDQQFLDAVAVAMITPGPVVITVAFIGYIVAGAAGATVAAFATFLPCYLFTVIPAPYFSRWSKNVQIKAFVAGVTAAAAGAIAGAALVLGRRALIDVPTVLLAVATFIAVSKVKRLPEPLVIAAAGIVGLFLR